MLTIIVAGERKERFSVARDQYMHPDARLVPNAEGARWDDRDDSKSVFGLVGVLRCSATRSWWDSGKSMDIGKPGSQDTLKSYWKDESRRERQMRAV